MKPILFNAAMVRAILDGRKTVTRRVLNYKHLRGLENLTAKKIQRACVAPYQTGDILWVRETWKKACACERYYENGEVISSDELFGYKYRADNAIRWDGRNPRDDEFFLSEITEEEKWHPSIHMPREAARIWLRVTNVRVERLQDIEEDGAQAEGLCVGWSSTPKSSKSCSARQAFMWLWDGTIKPADRDRYGWAANPFCWVIEFEKMKK